MAGDQGGAREGGPREARVRQVIQMVGAFLILVPFTANQLGRWTSDSATYLVLNVVGSATLGVIALLERQWGFVLLEFVWAAVAAVSLVRGARPGAGAATG
jgi:hypothetical protein